MNIFVLFPGVSLVHHKLPRLCCPDISSIMSAVQSSADLIVSEIHTYISSFYLNESWVNEKTDQQKALKQTILLMNTTVKCGYFM